MNPPQEERFAPMYPNNYLRRDTEGGLVLSDTSTITAKSNRAIDVVDITMALGDSVSSAFDMRFYAGMTVVIPEDFEGIPQLEASADGITFYPYSNSFGNPLTINVDPNPSEEAIAYEVPQTSFAIHYGRFATYVDATRTTPVTQSADRALQVWLKS